MGQIRLGQPVNRRLGDLLVAEGLVKQEQLQRALAEQKGTTEKLGSVLVRLKLVNEEQLTGFLSRQRDGRDGVLSGQKTGELFLVDKLQPDEDRSELLSGPLLFGERALQLFLLDEPFGDQEISQSPVHRLPQPDLPHLTFLRYSPQSLQCIRKGSVRIVLVEDEGDPFQAGVTGL